MLTAIDNEALLNWNICEVFPRQVYIDLDRFLAAYMQILLPHNEPRYPIFENYPDKSLLLVLTPDHQ